MQDRGQHAPRRGRRTARVAALRGLGSLWLCLALMFAASARVLAADASDGASEVDVQAAFLFKFGSYVEWPATAFPSPHAPFRIAVVGRAELAETLRTVTAGRSVLGRPVQVDALQPGAPLEGFQVVFIGTTEALADRIAALQRQSTLVVTKADAGLASGSMINFVVSGGKLRFDVSLAAVEASGLKLSSRLLAVARRVAGADGADGAG